MAILNNVSGMKACPKCKKSAPPFNWRMETRITLRDTEGPAQIVESRTYIVCKCCGFEVQT